MQLKGFIIVLLSAICFATNALWIKFAFDRGITVWELLTVQSIIASGTLLIITSIFSPKSFKVSKAQLGQIGVQGVCGVFATGVLFTMALQYISASLTTVLLYTYPALVTLASIVFLKQKVLGKHVVSLFMTLLGTLLVVNIFSREALGEVHIIGIILGLGSAVSYTFFNVYGERILADLSPLTVTTYGQLVATAALLIVKPPVFIFTSGISLELLYFGLLLAVMSSVTPFFLYLKGIGLVGANKASVISTFELPTTILLAYLFLQEQFLPIQLAGTVLILSGIFLVKSRVSEHDSLISQPTHSAK